MSTIAVPKFNIASLDPTRQGAIQARIDGKTKPPGALGQLESLASQISLILNDDAEQSLLLVKPTMVVFAADHGIAEEGVSIAPSVVTQQMVANFLTGGAAINCFCRSFDMALEVVDAGMLETNADSRLIKQRLGPGTHNFSRRAAMSLDNVHEGLGLGATLVRKIAEQGTNIIAFGEMGIGNTSSSAALMAAILDKPVDECVGRGTGIDDDHFARKVSLIEQSLALHREALSGPENMLACLGGFEIVQMVGAMLAAAECRMIIMVDGFIASVAALYAGKIAPNSRDYMVFCHQSHERGHVSVLSELNAKPLLDLELRLGEGTGAALAYPLLQAAVSFYNDMASFDTAGIEAV